MSCSGWMETANFHEWFVKMFLTSVSDIVKTGPVVLFLDGHKSHITLQLIEMAKEHNVIICDLSRKNPSYAFLISLTFNSCQAAILYRMPTSFGNQEEQ